MREDIPEAIRQSTVEKQPRFKLAFLGWMVAGAVLVFGLWLTFRPRTPLVKQSNPIPTPANATTPEILLGHFRYPEVPESQLRPIVSDGSIRLQSTAAEQFQAMVTAAEVDGIDLVPISGFRSVSDQKVLFFDVKAERGQGATERAQVSAPPRYSEHHTGYAVDIGEAASPKTNLNSSFETTPAFEWLQTNAARFSFELSFPKNNPQGVNYEPWHWRFVGNQHSLETFYKARNPSRKPN